MTDTTYNSGIRNSSKQVNEIPIRTETTSKLDSSQEGSHSLVGSDDGDQSSYGLEQDGTKMEGLEASAKLEHRTEPMSVSLKPALAPADPHTSQEAERVGSLKESSYEGQKDDVYLDPTPKTPRQEMSPSRNPAIAAEGQDDGSTSEIQSIMDQFDDCTDEIVGDETGQLTAGTEKACLKTPMEHPPRRSSLEPLRMSQQSPNDPFLDLEGRNQDISNSEEKTRAGQAHTSSLSQSVWLQDQNTPSSPNSTMSLPKIPPPEPDPEPDLPFDFHRFLEQLRHRTADPVAKFLRSFLVEFGKKQWMVHEQVKIINDFLTFITNKMAQCEVWRGVSDAEFDNAKEGMEKLVMNRLYSQTFSPAIPAPAPVQTAKGKKKAVERPLGASRRGQHQEDMERDEVLAQKVRIYGWVQEKHLDIPPIGDSGRRFLVLAQQGKASLSILQFRFRPDVTTELLKIKTYRAPRDKVICVLNCCKVIFGKTLVGRVEVKPYLTISRFVA